jgi:hypothetical protein
MDRRRGKYITVIIGVIISLIATGWVVFEIADISNGPEYPHSRPSPEMKGDGTLGE